MHYLKAASNKYLKAPPSSAGNEVAAPIRGAVYDHVTVGIYTSRLSKLFKLFFGRNSSGVHIGIFTTNGIEVDSTGKVTPVTIYSGWEMTNRQLRGHSRNNVNDLWVFYL